MKKIVTITTVCATVLASWPTAVMAQAQVTPASLERSVPAEAKLSSAFSAYPTGGAALSSRIADLIVADPTLAAELANYLKAGHGLNEAQREAARQGLAQAMVRLNIYAQDAPPPGDDMTTVAILAGLAGAGVLIGVLASKKSSASPN